MIPLRSYGSAMTSAVAIKTGTIDLALNSAGLPVRETETADVSLDLTKLAAAIGASASSGAALSGTMDVSVSGTFTFSDFGKPVTVTRPTNVTGTLGG